MRDPASWSRTRRKRPVRPAPRHGGAVAGAQDIDDPGDDLLCRSRNAGRRLDRADLDAFPAARACVDYVFHTTVQGVFEEIAHEAKIPAVG